MTTYKDKIANLRPLTVEDTISICKELVPPELKDCPWVVTGHGRKVCTTETELNCYTAAYGEAHVAKVREALRALRYTRMNAGVEVIDYGCGQALASMCLIEKMNKNGKAGLIRKITLIEPSEIALKRAALNLRHAITGCEIIEVPEYLPATSGTGGIERLDIEEPIAIHLFSNVLDIDTIDLKRLAQLVASSGRRHYVVCVGPADCREERINAFCQYFYPERIALLLDYRKKLFWQAKTPDAHWFGCLIKCFAFDFIPDKPVIIQYRYYPPMQLFAAYKLDETEGFQAAEEDDERMTGVFDVLAPFDIAAAVHDDVHPVLAVLSNMISRGLPAKASPMLEEEARGIFRHTVLDRSLGGIRYVKDKDNVSEDAKIPLRWVPIAVARLEKVVIEAMILGRLSMKDKSWNVLVKENDVPCAALAFKELRDMFNHLTAMTERYADLTFPAIKLTIINSRYPSSAFHIGNKVRRAADASCLANSYDMVADINTMPYTDPMGVSFTEFKAKNGCYLAIRSSQASESKARNGLVTRTFYTAERIVYKPFTERNAIGTYDKIEPNVEHLRFFLQLLFRKQDFRDGQLPILTRALQLKSVIGLLPTGGGKSLTYQLAALLQPGITVVIDPLRSLMKDQYDGLAHNGIDCCTYINSDLSSVERDKRETMLKESKILMLFMSPERLCIFKFRETLKAMRDCRVFFSYGVIDEVHCVSEWGHDFRFSYLHLGRNLYNYVLPKQTDDERLNRITLFGLTATASFDVLTDVERELSGDNAFPLDADATVRYENTNRLELQYKVIRIPFSEYANKWDVYRTKAELVSDVVSECRGYLKELLEPQSVERIKSRFIERENITDKNRIRQISDADLNVDIPENWYKSKRNEASMIVFCPHRRGALGVNDRQNIDGSVAEEGIGTRISRKLEIHVSKFTGDTDLSVQDDFIQGKSNIIVATKAFGMGIDKPNVRFTANMNFSSSLESFVQEAGRAGRDGKMALAVIMYCGSSSYDPKTHELSPWTVDCEVNKYFYGENFKGINYEKRVMYHLMSSQQTQVNNTSVKGFLASLDNADVGKSLPFVISYAYPSDDSRELERRLGDKSIGKEEYCKVIEKAIYRLCCVGIVDDFTQDYNASIFRIVARKRAEGEYYACLKRFLLRYFNEERAESETRRAATFKGENEMQRCLGFLTDFVYSNIATKRWRAITDIEKFCHRAVSDDGKTWLEKNEDMKDFIYYYFNSKYAREGYKTVKGEPFSLTEDTDRGKLSSFDILFKYLRVTDEDMMEAGATEKDNIRHLQGAVRLIRRAVTEPNPTLCLLNVFCILFLNDINGDDSMRDELYSDYADGYKGFYDAETDKQIFYAKMDEFHNELRKHDISREAIQSLHGLQAKAEVKIAAEWTKKFARQYAGTSPAK